MENKPKGALSQISKVVDSAIDWIIVIMFASLIVSCVTQVFMRSILNDSPPWTEELARYSFMYVNFIGAVICVREKVARACNGDPGRTERYGAQGA